MAIGLAGVIAAVTLLDTPPSAVPDPSPSVGADSAPQASSEPPSSPGGIDDRIAFWEARIAANATDYSSTLALIDAYLARVRASGDLSDIGRAETALDRARSLAPVGDVGLLLREGLVAFTSHDFTGARDAAAELLRRDPGNESGVALFGDASIELGDEAAGIESYLELEPIATAPVFSRLARYSLLIGDVDAAETQMRSALDAAIRQGFPDQVASYRFQLAEFMRGENRIDEAAAEYEAVLDVLPEHAAARAGLARVREAQGRRAEAIELLERTTAALPSPQFVAELGDLYALDGDAGRAADSYALVERIAEVAMATGGVYDRQLVLFLADHDLRPDEAVRLAEAELATRKDVFGYDAYAWALYKAGRIDAAADAAAEALRLGTPDGRILYHAGMIAAADGRPADALDLLARAEMHGAALPSLQVQALTETLDALGG